MIIGKIATSESPIEDLMLDALMSVHPGAVRLSRDTTFRELRDAANGHPDGVFIVPQMEIGCYRVDYMLAANAWDLRFLCVECDGREFHSSPEQARRDVERDNFFLSHGVSVKRFSGSRIFKDRWSCAYEAIAKVTGGRFRRENAGFLSVGEALRNVMNITTDEATP